MLSNGSTQMDGPRGVSAAAVGAVAGAASDAISRYPTLVTVSILNAPPPTPLASRRSRPITRFSASSPTRTPGQQVSKSSSRDRIRPSARSSVTSTCITRGSMNSSRPSSCATRRDAGSMLSAPSLTGDSRARMIRSRVVTCWGPAIAGAPSASAAPEANSR